MRDIFEALLGSRRHLIVERSSRRRPDPALRFLFLSQQIRGAKNLRDEFTKQSAERGEARASPREPLLDRFGKPGPIALANPLERNPLGEAQLRQRSDAVIETDFLDDLAILEAQHRGPGEVHR